MTGPAIEVHGLRKDYGTFAAVDGVDLEVEHGEIFALLGPNGAGKTTTIEILEGYRRRTSGSVSVLGVDPADAGSSWRERIGLVLQASRPSDELTVEELVSHFALFYPNPRDPDEVIELVGLAEKRSSRSGKLSGGQLRRLDVALGIIGRPSLLFLDEPTTGFDPEARRHFWQLIEQLKHEGTTVLLTTHYLEEAEALADRVAVLAAGRIQALGSPATLGGRDTDAAIVRWTDADGPHEARTDRPTALVAELSARLGGEIPELTVSRPSLEDIYLRLIERPSDQAVVR